MANFYRLHQVSNGAEVDINLDFVAEIASDSYGTYLTVMPSGKTIIVREQYQYDAQGTLFFPPGQNTSS